MLLINDLISLGKLHVLSCTCMSWAGCTSPSERPTLLFSQRSRPHHPQHASSQNTWESHFSADSRQLDTTKRPVISKEMHTGITTSIGILNGKDYIRRKGIL